MLRLLQLQWLLWHLPSSNLHLPHLLRGVRYRARESPLLLWRALQGPPWPFHLSGLQQLMLLVLHLQVRLLVLLLLLLAPPLLHLLVVLQKRGLPQLSELLLLHRHARCLARLLRQLPPFSLVVLHQAEARIQAGL